MNDDFLYKNRPPVRKAFAESLSQRLLTLDSNQQVQQNGVHPMKPIVMQSGIHRLALPMLILLAALTFTFAYSEPVRAKTLEFILEIAGFRVEERYESPIKVLDQNVSSPTQAVPLNPITVPGVSQESLTPTESTVYTVPTVVVTGIIKSPPFQFGLPTWIPDGYILDEAAGIATSNNWVSLLWNNPNLSEIELLIEREYSGYSISAGENSSEEIEIHEMPALLIRGFWNRQHQWDPKLGISLDWEKDGRHYHLNYSEREAVHHEIIPIKGDTEKIIEALIKMAGSIP